jgi:dolichol-phosphate mannosyltransferase
MVNAIPDISLIVALYYEEECVEAFIDAVRKALDDQPITYEIVFVDDGSQDQTVPIVKRLAEADTRLKLVQLSRNHGKEAAVTAGITYASGAYMVMMDPDLQDPPERIMDFYDKIREGYDLVFGIREERTDSWATKLFSKLFWGFLEVMTGLEIPKNLSVMRIFNRAFANEFLKYPERLRFIEGLFIAVGMRRTTMPVEHRARYAGVSKFNFKRRIKLAINAIAAFSDKPLSLAIGTGFTLLGLSLVYGFYAFIRKVFFGVALTGWTSLFLSILFVGSIQIILLGIIGNYVGRVYTEVKRRPVFGVLETVNLEKSADAENNA